MEKKDLIIRVTIILMIFALGFLIRYESVNLSGIPISEKHFYENDYGLPYMYDMDSYYNYRLTENFLNHGYIGDTKLNGVEWDSYSYYPPGVPMDYPPLIVYLTAFIYKLINLFGSVPLIVISFWLSAFIAPLSGIIAYLFVNRVTNNYGALTAGILTVTAPFYFMRTIPGWFDTDIFILLFPLIISWLIYEAENSNKNSKLILYSLMAGILTVLFAISWNGWAYIFLIIIFSFLIYFISSKFLKFKIINHLKIFTIFIITTVLILILFTGLSNLDTILFPLNFIESSSHSYWPNIYDSITELQIPSLMDTISGIGPILLALGILGLVYIPFILKKKETFNYLNKFNWFFYVFLVIWVLIGVFSLTKGIRFLLILMPPLIIFSGIITGYFTDVLGNSDLKDKKLLISLVFIVLIFIPSVLIISDNIHNLKPRMNDDIMDSGIWINENTSNNTIIISDWIYGHFFTSFSNRPVLIDGSNQNSPRTYLIYKAFATDNETLSAGIFKMLTNSGDMGYLTLDEYTKNTTKTVEIMNNILGVDNSTAKDILIKDYQFNDEMADDVLKYTHPPVENPFVLVTYDSMIDGGYWFFNFGSWDFIHNVNDNFLYSYSNLEINEFNITSDDGLFMDLKTQNILWNNKTPYDLVIIKNGFITKANINNMSKFSVILNIDEKKSVVMDKQFENSLFTKLVVEKADSNLFQKIYRNQGVTVWKMNVQSDIQ